MVLADAADPSLWTQLFGPWGASLFVLSIGCVTMGRALLASLSRERKLYDRVIEEVEKIIPIVEANTRELRRIDRGRD